MRRLLNNLLCLIVCFTLVGCNQVQVKEKQKAEAMGRYVEETCKVEELIDENGNICLWKDEANNQENGKKPIVKFVMYLIEKIRVLKV